MGRKKRRKKKAKPAESVHSAHGERVLMMLACFGILSKSSPGFTDAELEFSPHLCVLKFPDNELAFGLEWSDEDDLAGFTVGSKGPGADPDVVRNLSRALCPSAPEPSHEGIGYFSVGFFPKEEALLRLEIADVLMAERDAVRPGGVEDPLGSLFDQRPAVITTLANRALSKDEGLDDLVDAILTYIRDGEHVYAIDPGLQEALERTEPPDEHTVPFEGFAVEYQDGDERAVSFVLHCDEIAKVFTHDNNEKIPHLVANLCAYLEAVPADIERSDGQAPRADRRRQKKGAQGSVRPKYVTNYVGRSHASARGSSDGGQKRRHWVRGHWRNQPYGPRSNPKYRKRWIPPHQRGDGDAPQGHTHIVRTV